MTVSGGWDAVRQAMRQRVGRAAYEAWFDRLEGRSEGEALVIVCPDRFSCAWLESRYGASLRAVATAYKFIKFEAREGGTRQESIRKNTLDRPKAPHIAQRAPAQAPPERAAGAEASFDTFIAGPANLLAVEAARAVAAGRGGRCNPLVITGASGVGKTHLCRAIEQSADRVVYRSSEQFTIEVTQAMRSGAMEAVRHRYRRASNLLILDDVQFLEGKRATQSELFHTIEHLVERGRPVVVASDRPPHELDLDPKLRARLGSGLIARIGLSDVEMARRILRSRAAYGGIRLSDECLELLAIQPAKTARDVVSALNQVVARATLLRRQIDADLVRETLSDVGIAAPQRSLSEIIDATARTYGLTHAQLMCRSRRRTLVVPRQLAMYLCRRLTDASLAEIGRALGRDHSTVIHGIRSVESRVASKPQLRYELESIAARLGAPVAIP